MKKEHYEITFCLCIIYKTSSLGDKEVDKKNILFI